MAKACALKSWKCLGSTSITSSHEEDTLAKGLHEQSRDIFKAAVDAVLPHRMVSRALKLSGKQLEVGNRTYILHNNVYVVAFGKAVIGMIRAVEDLLGDHIVDGVASVPVGLQQTLKSMEMWDLLPKTNSRVKLMEGAANNIPDAAAFEAAMEIFKLASKLNESHLLLTLISGGGSALLPAPTPPITLDEMTQVTVTMSKAGATIQQMNTVRKRLELLKGGGLANEAAPAKVIALFLSDVIGDPLDFIASGPTVADHSNSQQCLDMFYTLGVTGSIPSTVVDFLETDAANKATKSWTGGSGTQISNMYTHIAVPSEDYSHVQNQIIGNNTIAAMAAESKAQELGYIPVLLTVEQTGEAQDVGRMYGLLASYLCCCMAGLPVGNVESMSFLEIELIRLGISKNKINELRKAATQVIHSNRSLCVLGAGETVVNVRGTGKGGRNQELALACAICMQEMMTPSVTRDFSVQMLSAGTDGQDGPTEAAGAFAHPHLVDKANTVGLSPQNFLDDNDTFNFYSMIEDGKYLLTTGLTGTNVMDLQILLINPNSV